MTLSRRSFFTGLATLIATPAIVRAESLMKLAPTRIIFKPSTLVITDYPLDMDVTRLDVLYGYMRVRPEWTAIVPEFPLSLDKYSERILAPLVNRLAQSVADAVMDGNGASWVTFEADGTGSLPKGARQRVPAIAPIRLSDLLREAKGHQFA